MLKKVQVLTTVILMIFSTAAVSAQKRQPNRRNTRTQSPKAPNTTTQSPNAPVANIPDPPLIPTYEAASKNNPNRVILPVSDVGNPKGAKLIRMFVRYAYDNNWKEIGHLNEVAERLE
jgi:hypothetical protein